jgi:hypothetical protein
MRLQYGGSKVERVNIGDNCLLFLLFLSTYFEVCAFWHSNAPDIFSKLLQLPKRDSCMANLAISVDSAPSYREGEGIMNIIDSDARHSLTEPHGS